MTAGCARARESAWTVTGTALCSFCARRVAGTHFDPVKKVRCLEGTFYHERSHKTLRDVIRAEVLAGLFRVHAWVFLCVRFSDCWFGTIWWPLKRLHELGCFSGFGAWCWRTFVSYLMAFCSGLPSTVWKRRTFTGHFPLWAIRRTIRYAKTLAIPFWVCLMVPKQALCHLCLWPHEASFTNYWLAKLSR